MRNVVWISPHLPYDNVNHAGGNIQNYYLKELIKETDFNVKLISFYKPEELQKFTFNKTIDCRLYCYDNSGLKKIVRNIIDSNYLVNPLNRYGNKTTLYIKLCIKHELNQLKKEGFIPDVIILQWTQTVFFAKEVKKIFPDAKIVGIEEDVTLLSCRRAIDLAENKIEKYIKKIKFKNVEKQEIDALHRCDLVILNNYKDKGILDNYGKFKKIFVWSPYYNDMSELDNTYGASNEILFYGAMSRPENYNTVKWIIEKVRPILLARGIKLKYMVVGGNPHCCMDKYRTYSDVEITGFVDDVTPYFEKAFCLVAPLVLGAGIKIKILEAMSSGIAVITNSIGIEGIPAIDKIHYLHAEQPVEYADYLENLLNGQIDKKQLGINGRQLVKDTFCFVKSAELFRKEILQL